MEETRKITDQFGNELNVGDFVCFVGNPDAGWRQTKHIVREQIKDIICGVKTKDGVYWDWIVCGEDNKKISPSRVVKCY